MEGWMLDDFIHKVCNIVNLIFINHLYNEIILAFVNLK